MMLVRQHRFELSVREELTRGSFSRSSRGPIRPAALSASASANTCRRLLSLLARTAPVGSPVFRIQPRHLSSDVRDRDLTELIDDTVDRCSGA